MTEETAPIYSRNNPFPARITERRRLTAEAGDKETMHVSLDIGGSGMRYACGDTMGVYPWNSAARVAAFLAAFGLRGDEPVDVAGTEWTLRDALTKKFSLNSPTAAFATAVCERAVNQTEKDTLKTALATPADTKAWLGARDYTDIGQEFPSARFTAGELVKFLGKLAPRLYSIASSPQVNSQKVDLLVAVVRYEIGGREREGVCSNYLARHAEENKSEVSVFVTPTHFSLPKDGDTPIIMVGPGAGLAPFRGFLQERDSTKARGENWLFFGDRRKTCDFLYEDELMKWNSPDKDGRIVLTKLSLAWSRDQEGRKVYVQDLMREEGAELWTWLERGAALYVCGDARCMARDVDLALHDLITQHGTKTPEETRNYIAHLKKTGRYQRDVY